MLNDAPRLKLVVQTSTPMGYLLIKSKLRMSYRVYHLCRGLHQPSSKLVTSTNVGMVALKSCISLSEYLSKVLDVFIQLYEHVQVLGYVFERVQHHRTAL